MAEQLPATVKETVYRLQHYLLEGIKNERQLLASGSIISRSDYEDVVTERTIVNLCGYPLCRNSLLAERLRKGRYRISLKEHKVYDLQETYMFCSSSCVVSSRAFSGSLQEERVSHLDPLKLSRILSLFGDGGSDDGDVSTGKVGDLGLAALSIQEKVGGKPGEVSFEEWIGPSDAIEGHIPKTDKSRTHPRYKDHKMEVAGSNVNTSRPKREAESFSFSEMEFSSTVIMNDEYAISKTPSRAMEDASYSKSEELEEERIHKGFEDLRLESPSVPNNKSGKTTRDVEGDRKVKLVNGGKDDISTLTSYKSSLNMNGSMSELNHNAEGGGRSTEASLKPSLKSSESKKLNRCVTWADEKTGCAGGGNLCEVREMTDTKVVSVLNDALRNGGEDHMLRLELAEACAEALSQAAEAVAAGDSEVDDAVSGAGIIILPSSEEPRRGEHSGSATHIDSGPLSETAPLKWPNKPGVPQSDIFDSDNSWFDDPPEGFSLILSSFATMWNALFEWVTSSSLAYIYGREDSSGEEYSMINGKEYPQKVVMDDGRSSEIKGTLAGCISRVLPGLLYDLRISVSLSTLEKAMGQLLETMTFVNPLPAIKVKQWRVMVLIYMEALSVCRLPALRPHMIERRMLLHKAVLEPAQITVEEYDIMKDVIIPLGRAPHFSSQSGA